MPRLLPFYSPFSMASGKSRGMNNAPGRAVSGDKVGRAHLCRKSAIDARAPPSCPMSCGGEGGTPSPTPLPLGTSSFLGFPDAPKPGRSANLFPLPLALRGHMSAGRGGASLPLASGRGYCGTCAAGTFPAPSKICRIMKIPVFNAHVSRHLRK